MSLWVGSEFIDFEKRVFGFTLYWNSVDWDYGSGEDVNVQITNRKIILRSSITVGHLSIEDGGILVFGEPATEGIEIFRPLDRKIRFATNFVQSVAWKINQRQMSAKIYLKICQLDQISSLNILSQDEVIELRALAISVREGGELWIGNKGCRYQHDATITLYGDNQAMKNGWFFDPEDTWLENSSTDTSKGRVEKLNLII